MQTTKVICKQALAFLEAQRLPPSPTNYQLAFAFAAGAPAELVKTLSAMIDGGVRITQAEADALNDSFFARPAEPVVRPCAESSADSIRHRTLRLADLAASATAATGEFSRELSIRLHGINAVDSESLYDLVVAMIGRSQRAEQELAATSAEVEQLRRELEVAQGDAERDVLTGLPNRRGIDAYLKAARGKAPMAIALCDVDRFKAYNDRYGHAVGDRVLKTVAHMLQESLPGQFGGRWGGEEFLIVARADVATAVALIERAKALLGAKHFKLRETDEPLGRISFSAGVTALPHETDQLEAALHHADALLYQAKCEGRDRVLGGGAPACTNAA
jgi:diguanylate cyclase